MFKYDFIIVGSGLFGSICAYELNKKKYKCLVLEKRNHIGGNCYTENRDNINIHLYGPHIFHTSNEKIWNWINQFVKFNNFIYSPIANYKNELYSLPFNMHTFYQLWKTISPDQAKNVINSQCLNIENPKNLEEQALKTVGSDIYHKLIKGYTEKQWRKPANELPPEIIKRIPIRYNYNNNYFNDSYQGIPIGGYTNIFKKLLHNIEVKLNTDYLNNRNHWDSLAKKIIYTGPIDRFYNYEFGELEYKTTNFEHELLNIENYQGISVVNYTDINIPYTRIIEHKHFENSNSNYTWITKEYPVEYNARISEPYYPVNDNINNKKYNKYKEKSISNKKIIFGGRLAEYKYYDMHNVIQSALNLSDLFNKI